MTTHRAHHRTPEGPRRARARTDHRDAALRRLAALSCGLTVATVTATGGLAVAIAEAPQASVSALLGRLAGSAEPLTTVPDPADADEPATGQEGRAATGDDRETKPEVAPEKSEAEETEPPEETEQPEQPEPEQPEAPPRLAPPPAPPTAAPAAPEARDEEAPVEEQTEKQVKNPSETASSGS
jgi:hypothetical protein